jgi:hypothetical protein
MVEPRDDGPIRCFLTVQGATSERPLPPTLVELIDPGTGQAGSDAGYGSGNCSSSCWCPGNGHIPNKELLPAWYTRIGYRPVRSGTIDESYPWLALLLATPCDFVIYHKDLAQT